MLNSARASVARRGLAAGIVLRKGDATAFDPSELFALDGFDRVFISYALSMIPAWRDVVRQAAACVAPGGELFIVDFGNFERYPAFLRSAQLAWLRRFSVEPIPAIERKIGMLASRWVSRQRLKSSMAAMPFRFASSIADATGPFRRD